MDVKKHCVGLLVAGGAFLYKRKSSTNPTLHDDGYIEMAEQPGAVQRASEISYGDL